jgi:hypothetical protein
MNEIFFECGYFFFDMPTEVLGTILSIEVANPYDLRLALPERISVS